jgi:hypothetical protein
VGDDSWCVRRDQHGDHEAVPLGPGMRLCRDTCRRSLAECRRQLIHQQWLWLRISPFKERIVRNNEKWWRVKDSNLRTQREQIYSLPQLPLCEPATLNCQIFICQSPDSLTARTTGFCRNCFALSPRLALRGCTACQPHLTGLPTARCATMRTRHVKERIYCIDTGDQASKKPMAISDA